MLSLPSSSSSISRRKYDVFLSFRGEDTRNNFTDHLYDALQRNGIVTFRDDPNLEAGEEIAPELLQAIQQSWCSVIVFSNTYAFSSWCLEELAEIVKRKMETGHKVFPIFYDMDPSDLRKQKEKVGEAFAKHQERFKEDEILKWRNALTQVANIKGWHLNNRHESEFIGDIVKKISAKLCQTYPVVIDELIGTDSRSEELYSKIEIGEDDVRIIGICGMGGVGKTTLARVVYNQMSSHFEGKSFLADVREVSNKSGLVSLQKQLLAQILPEEGFNFFNVHEGNAIISHRLAHKKVLLVLDDVENMQHLKCLVGRRDWFGLGSRIIITTRDEHLLQSYRVDDVYKPTTLDDNDAFRLFNMKAFDSDTVPEGDFIKLSKRVVEYAGGLPLALEVLGSFLCGRDAAQWRSAIERLKRDSNKEILDRLRIGFDGLEESEKNIFLDIASFFGRTKKDFVNKVLDGCGFFPDIGIDVLVKKSLIKIDEHNQYLWMHDLLRDMGRKIVKETSLDEPGQRCRLWEESDVHHVLTKNTVTEVVETIIIDNKWESERLLNLSDAFLKMKKLRLLKVLCLSNCDNLNYLSNELRLLDWTRFPLRSLPSSFQPDNLVALVLSYSRIQQLWKGSRPLYKLNVVNLKGSENLIHTPDFTAAPNLEFLILEGCTNLVDVHPSVGVLRRLKVFNLKDCKSLRSLPAKIGMESLETLILSGCSNLRKLPEIDGKMEYLLELDCKGTCIRELPSSFGHLRRLKILNLTKCRSLRGLPTINGMESLEKIILSGCSNLKSFPEIDGKMECLLELYLDGTGIEELPSSIGNLSSLVLLNLKDCSNLVSLPSSIGGCTSLRTLNLSGCKRAENLPENLQQVEFLEKLDLSETAITEPLSFIFQFKNMKVLSFSGCKAHSSELRKSMSSLFKVTQRGRANPKALMLPSLLGLSSLTKLKLRDCNLCEGDIPNDISCLSSLETLDLSGNNFLSIPSSLTQLPNLEYLALSNCRKLKSLPELVTNIRSVRIDDCVSLELVAYPPKVCNSMAWAYIRGINCYRLAENVVNALALLKNHLKVFANSRKIFDIVIPGNEIPGWFSHQRVSSSIKIPLPLNIRNDSQWMGVAFCCIFVNDDASREEDLFCQAVIHHGNSGQAGSDGSSRTVDGSGFSLGKEFNQPIKEDHLFLRYWSCDQLYPSSLEDKCGESETENSSTSDGSNRDCDELELSLVPGFYKKRVKVKKCGVRIVYEKDLEDFQLIKGKNSNQSFAEIVDMNHDSATAGAISNGPLAKQNRIMCLLGGKHLDNVFSCIMGLLEEKHGRFPVTILVLIFVVVFFLYPCYSYVFY